MSLAALLRRATAAELAESWPYGAHVARTIYVPLEGRVVFVDGGFVYWAGEDRHIHASHPSALRRIQ